MKVIDKKNLYIRNFKYKNESKLRIFNIADTPPRQICENSYCTHSTRININKHHTFQITSDISFCLQNNNILLTEKSGKFLDNFSNKVLMKQFSLDIFT